MCLSLMYIYTVSLKEYVSDSLHLGYNIEHVEIRVFRSSYVTYGHEYIMIVGFLKHKQLKTACFIIHVAHSTRQMQHKD